MYTDVNIDGKLRCWHRLGLFAHNIPTSRRLYGEGGYSLIFGVDMCISVASNICMHILYSIFNSVGKQFTRCVEVAAPGMSIATRVVDMDQFTITT